MTPPHAYWKEFRSRLQRLAPTRFSGRHVLIFSILLRGIIFLILYPFNPDQHFQNILHIAQFKALPPSSLYTHSFHPPLYYLIGYLFYCFGGIKTVQFFSLLTAIATSYFIYRLYRLSVNRSPDDAASPSLMLILFLPEFITFSLFISNDSLSFLVGIVLLYQGYRYIKRPDIRQLSILAVWLGVGLLTKGTFIAFIPPLILLVGFMNRKIRGTWLQCAGSLTLFLLLAIGIGSYKFIENYLTEGRLIIHSLDYHPDWGEAQKPAFQSWISLVDINLIKLIEEPVLSKRTIHSFPLMLYGTLWYQYIYYESSFTGPRTSLKYIGSLIYLLGVIPTLLMLAGLFRIPAQIRSMVHAQPDSSDFHRTALGVLSVLLLGSTFCLVIYGGLKYDVWSFFQARCLFPAIYGFIVLMDLGWASALRLSPAISRYLRWNVNLLLALMVIYLFWEVVIATVSRML